MDKVEMMNVDFPTTLWFEVARHVTRDWRAYRPLAQVSKATREGVFAYLAQHVIPKLAAQLTAYTRPLDLSGLTPLCAYKSLREALQKPYPTSVSRRMRTPLQSMVEMGCTTLLTKEQFRSLVDLCKNSSPLAETSFQNQLSLIMVCYQLPLLFARKFEPSERKQYYSQQLEIFSLLLNHGVNPNLLGEKTPLIALLEQMPYSVEDQELMNKMIRLLLEHGADPYSALISRSGKKLPSAWRLAQKGPFKDLFPPRTPQKGDSTEKICALVRALIYRK